MQRIASSSIRLRQSLLTAALAVPVVIAIAVAPPFEAAPVAGAPQHMVGPNYPIMVGSAGVVPTRSGNVISYTSPWTCGELHGHDFTLSNPDGSGRFRTVSRDLGGLRQTLTITGFTKGSPSQFTETEDRGGVTIHTSTITALDSNGDGIFDSVRFTGQHNVTLNFVYTGDDTISFPWSQASAIGFDTQNDSSCAGAIPQAWIPLADTNGDSHGDAIVWDLDGNGMPDADMYSGPPVGVPSVPAMGPVARFILLVLIALTGGWFVSRRGDHAPGLQA